MASSEELLRLAGQVLIGGFEGTELPALVRERLARGHLAGLIFFKRNLTAQPHELASLCAQSLACAPVGDPSLLLAIDQEGGRVARLAAPFPRVPAMRKLGTHDVPSLTEQTGALLGHCLAALGINWDFAPVADVDSNPDNPVIGDRSFGRDPALVARHVEAFVRGLQASGVAGCAKHFPGHGDTSQDSHHELPHLSHDLARLNAVELPPFRASFTANVASVMTAHVVFAPLTGSEPATFSPAVVRELLRETLGYRGVCVSDDLLMRAVADRCSTGEGAVRAIAAGCDVLLVCNNLEAQQEALEALAAKASSDEVFRARLQEAAERTTQLRKQFPAKASTPEQALSVWNAPEQRAVEARLASLGTNA